MAVFIVLFLLAIASSSEAIMKKKCEKLQIPMCKRFGYTHTIFPNPLSKIKTQIETVKIAALMNSENLGGYCKSKETIGFVCAVYAPKCFRGVKGRVVPPCREFCEHVIGSCRNQLATKAITSDWLTLVAMRQEFNCSTYPKVGEATCINDTSMTVTKKAKLTQEDTKCCRLGRRAAKKGFNCTLANITVPTTTKNIKQTTNFVEIIKKKCQAEEQVFTKCCMEKHDKKAKKTEKKEQKNAKKQKKQEKKQKKQEKKQKKQEKKEQRKQKKQNRKDKKKLRKTKKNQRKENKQRG